MRFFVVCVLVWVCACVCVFLKHIQTVKAVLKEVRLISACHSHKIDTIESRISSVLILIRRKIQLPLECRSKSQSENHINYIRRQS